MSVSVPVTCVVRMRDPLYFEERAFWKPIAIATR
jgi:hypothetical protein